MVGARSHSTADHNLQKEGHREPEALDGGDLDGVDADDGATHDAEDDRQHQVVLVEPAIDHDVLVAQNRGAALPVREARDARIVRHLTAPFPASWAERTCRRPQ